MAIDTLQVVAKTATTIDLSVNNSDPVGRTAASMRDTATGDPFDDSDKQDLVDGVAGDINIDVASAATTSLPFSGLDPLKTYHVGVTNYAVEDPEPPPNPDPGDVPVPTNLTSPAKTATTIDLAWDPYENTGANADIFSYDFPDDTAIPPYMRIQGEFPFLPNGTEFRWTSNNTAANWHADYNPKVSTDQSRFGTRSYKFTPTWATTVVKQCRQEMELMADADGSGDLHRFVENTDYAFGYSMYLDNDAGHNSYQNMGQLHQSKDDNESYGVSPIFTTNISDDDLFEWYARYQTKAISLAEDGKPTLVADGRAVNWSTDTKRWVDVVWLFRLDPTGVKVWPQDGAAPYAGHVELYHDGKLIFSVSAAHFGINDNYAGGRGHWLRLGLYCGWKDAAKVAAMTGEPPVVYIDSIKVASGANATYANVGPGGRVTSFRVERQVAGSWSAIKTGIPPGEKSTQLTGLTGATEYVLRVKAVFGEDESVPTSNVTVTTS